MNKPIRVLHVIRLMNRGGAEAMIMNLYRCIDRTQVVFDFVENSDEPAEFDDEILSLGGRIFRCPHYNGRNHFAYRKWWEDFFTAHAGEYRIIHGHLGSTAAIYLSIAKRFGLFTIAHSHSSGTDHSLRNLIYSIYSYRTRFIADQLFACSEIAGRDRYGKKADIIVLRNAIDPEEFQYSADVSHRIRGALGIEGKTVIGHIGRFVKPKNHEYLLDVFQELLKRKPDSVLLLVGDGELRGRIESKANALGIWENVVFTGVRSDVSDLLQAMDILVFPSLYEGLPLTLVEAQAAGLPCVISDRVPQECMFTKDLVSVVALDDPVDCWVDQILSCIEGKQRHSRTEDVRTAGYDVHMTANWLQEFYRKNYHE